jgi:glutathione S-transferase
MHDEVIAEFRPRAEAALSFVDKTVKDRPFLLGDACTIADIGCWGRMVFMAERGVRDRKLAASGSLGRPPQGNARFCATLRSDP